MTTTTNSKVFCGTDGEHFCSVGCQVKGAHRDNALNNPWVEVKDECPCGATIFGEPATRDQCGCGTTFQLRHGGPTVTRLPLDPADYIVPDVTGDETEEWGL
jgi:hypothetical protein